MKERDLVLEVALKEQYLPIVHYESEGIVKIVAGYINTLGNFGFVSEQHNASEDFSMKDFGKKIGQSLSHDIQGYGLILHSCHIPLSPEELEDLHDGIDSVLENYD